MAQGNQSWWPPMSLIILFLFTSLLPIAEGQSLMHPFTSPLWSQNEVTASTDQPIKHWNLDSWIFNAYDYGVSKDVFYKKKNSAFIRSNANIAQPDTQAILSQSFSADRYRKKRMRFSAVLKVDGVDMSAALTMSVQSTYSTLLSYDDMYGRNITGTSDWKMLKSVLEVPKDSGFITFGIIVRGLGQVWISDVKFEPTKDAVTGVQLFADKPENLGFSDV